MTVVVPFYSNYSGGGKVVERSRAQAIDQFRHSRIVSEDHQAVGLLKSFLNKIEEAGDRCFVNTSVELEETTQLRMVDFGRSPGTVRRAGQDVFGMDTLRGEVPCHPRGIPLTTGVERTVKIALCGIIPARFGMAGNVEGFHSQYCNIFALFGYNTGQNKEGASMTNIVITGCSTGIGLATAKHLKDRFIRVYPTARRIEDVEMLRGLGFENAMQLDVRNPDQVAAVIESVLNKEGKIDAWFNNAGYGQMGAVEDVPTEVLREQFETNVLGLHECTRQIMPVMRRQGYGKIIQHSSVLGIIALPFRGIYNASKYAIEGLTDTLRLELKGTEIYPVLLNTGPITSRFRETAIESLDRIDTEHSEFASLYEASRNGTAKRVPFNEGPEAVARIVYQILSDEHPRPRYYITKATYLLGYAKRLLSSTWLDKVLLKV